MGNEILQPSISLSLVSARTEVSNTDQKVLLVAQLLAGGSKTPGTLVENIPNDGSENAFFQRDSNAAELVRAFKRIAPEVQIDVIPLADAAGTKAEYTITLTGGATEGGTITTIAGSDKNHKVTSGVIKDEDITASAAAIIAAVNADLDNQFTAAAGTAGVLTLTSNHFGTIGNNMPVGCIGDGAFASVIAGLTIVITQTATGATDPAALDTSAVFDVVGNRRYQGVIHPYVASQAMVSAWLDSRFNVNNRVLDGVAFSKDVDTHTLIKARLDALNSKSLVVFCDEQVSDADYFGPAMPEDPSVIVTSFAAIRALRLTPDTALTQYLTTLASRDQFGGVHTATLPYFNTTIPQLPITRAGKGFTDGEIELLHDSGGAVVGQNSAGTGNLVGEVPTTYKTDPAANDDISWKYLN